LPDVFDLTLRQQIAMGLSYAQLACHVVDDALPVSRQHHRGDAHVVQGFDGAGGILALPSAGATLSIGTGGSRLKGVIDDLRITPKVLAPEKFMRKLPSGLVLILR
jgi:hypothetical protein